ncbi:COG0790 FOG, TPR repeat, SEL1 subfamily [Paracoccaceae bacterium]
MKHMISAMAVVALFAGAAARAEDSGDAAALKARSIYLAGDDARALALALPLAEAGVARAQTLVGLMYERGHGVAADPKKAMEWFAKAAAQGFPQALHNAAYNHEFGEGGLAVDKPKALAMYLQAAAQDFGPSLGNAGVMLREGKGVPVDMELAVALFERGVALSDPLSNAEFAYMLAEGVGVAVDLPRARGLYEIAAAQGIPWAMRDFGDMLERGEGGATDLPRAMDYFKRAVAEDYAMAGFDIAEMVWANPDTFPDPVAALAYCLWAEAQPPLSDGTDYDGMCDAAAADLGPEALTEAKVMADSF